MKNKVFPFSFFDILGILLAFFIAVGGLFLVEMMLDKEKQTVLSETGQVKMVLPPDTREEESKEKEEALKELADVVKTWESGGMEYPHEPGEGQLSMEEAVKISRKWVRNFYKKYKKQQLKEIKNLPKYRKVYASLCMKQKEPLKEETFVTMYSYWKITLVDKIMKAEFILNAATGQILDVVLLSYDTGLDFLDIPPKKVLHEYAASFDPEKEKQVKKDGAFRYEVLKKGELYAILLVNSLQEWEKEGYDYGYGNYLHLSLRAFLPSEAQNVKESSTDTFSNSEESIDKVKGK